jgi:hypothetical protein
MGLDQYLKYSSNEIKEEVDFEDPPDTKQFYYYRKHPAIHKWMENLYEKKGGAQASFNCVPVKLNKKDLAKLKKDILDRKLPENSTGFFWGTSVIDEDQIKEDISMVEQALDLIDSGKTIFYTSWW